MKIWKPWTKFLKPRDEWGYHADVALEEGEELSLLFPGDHFEKVIKCPPNCELKLHIEICAETFEKE